MSLKNEKDVNTKLVVIRLIACQSALDYNEVSYISSYCLIMYNAGVTKCLVKQCLTRQ